SPFVEKFPKKRHIPELLPCYEHS
ncbi:unnamed protein product, partial [Onchocerca ochengi]|uniref:Alpha/beta hydrolase n=1 Tax=Onchocerca ochengi TaxID=42157 RepID=A0A182EYZ4_ONCOC